MISIYIKHYYYFIKIDCNTSDSLFIALIQTLKDHSELESLILNNNRIGDEGMNKLICNFRYFINLKKLYIGENQFTYKSLKNFSDNALYLKNLEELVIYGILY